jgi:hypothetical protein
MSPLRRQDLAAQRALPQPRHDQPSFLRFLCSSIRRCRRIICRHPIANHRAQGRLHRDRIRNLRRVDLRCAQETGLAVIVVPHHEPRGIDIRVAEDSHLAGHCTETGWRRDRPRAGARPAARVLTGTRVGLQLRFAQRLCLGHEVGEHRTARDVGRRSLRGESAALRRCRVRPGPMVAAGKAEQPLGVWPNR